MADDDHRAAPEAAEPAHDGGVLGEVPVACERREVLDQRADVVETVRPVRVARDLRLLPGGELGVGIDQRLVRLLLQPRHLLGDRDGVVVAVDGLELGDLALELGDRLLEVEIGTDGDRAIHQLALRRVVGKKRAAIAATCADICCGPSDKSSTQVNAASGR